MTPITVIVPCKDERTTLPACLDSVAEIADELLVADSGSTDGTLEYVRNRGDCRVIEREYVNSADFKNWAIPQAKNEWILLLDADEQATPELVSEIREMKTQALADTSFEAFWIARSNWFLGKRIRFSGWRNDGVVRLFKRTCRYTPRRVHAEIELEKPQLGKLKHILSHDTYRSFEHFQKKQLRYANWSAEDLFDRGKKASVLNLVFRPAMRFFRQYVASLGFLDGKAGFIIACSAAQYVFMKYARVWELSQGLNDGEVPGQTNIQQAA